jgi:hypothetical protein
MTIELYFSNQLDQLADKFSDIFADENRICSFNVLVFSLPWVGTLH